MSEGGQGLQRNISLSVDQAAALDDWTQLEACSESDLLQKIIDRGFAAVESELNQRWINRDIRSRLLTSEQKD